MISFTSFLCFLALSGIGTDSPLASTNIAARHHLPTCPPVLPGTTLHSSLFVFFILFCVPSGPCERAAHATPPSFMRCNENYFRGAEGKGEVGRRTKRRSRDRGRVLRNLDWRSFLQWVASVRRAATGRQEGRDEKKADRGCCERS